MPKKTLILPPKTDPVWAAFRSPAPARQERKTLLGRRRRPRLPPEPQPDLLKPYRHLLTPEAPLLGYRSLRLEVVGYDPATQRYECRCDCGSTSFQVPNNVASGRARSCGCWHREQLAFSRLLALEPDKLKHTLETQSHLAAADDALLTRHRGIHRRWWEGLNISRWPYAADPNLGSFHVWFLALGPKPRPADEVSQPDTWAPFSVTNISWSTDAKALPYKPIPLWSHA